MDRGAGHPERGRGAGGRESIRPGMPAVAACLAVCVAGVEAFYEHSRIAWQIARNYRKQVRWPLRDTSSQVVTVSAILLLLVCHLIFSYIMIGLMPPWAFCAESLLCYVFVLLFGDERPLTALLVMHMFRCALRCGAFASVDSFAHLCWNLFVSSTFGLMYNTMIDWQTEPLSTFGERLDRLVQLARVSHVSFFIPPFLSTPLLLMNAYHWAGLWRWLHLSWAVWNIADENQWTVTLSTDCPLLPTLVSDVSVTVERCREALVYSLEVLSAHAELVISAAVNYRMLLEKHEVLRIVAAGCPFAGVYVGIGTADGRWASADAEPLSRPRVFLLVDSPLLPHGKPLTAMLWLRREPETRIFTWRIGPRVHDTECWAFTARRQFPSYGTNLQFPSITWLRSPSISWHCTGDERWDLRTEVLARDEELALLARRNPERMQEQSSPRTQALPDNDAVQQSIAQLEHEKAEAARAKAEAVRAQAEAARAQVELRAQLDEAKATAAAATVRSTRIEEERRQLEVSLLQSQQRTSALEQDLHTQQVAMNDILHNQEPASQDDEPPAHFICPIMQDIFHDPVVTADGATYEREAIEQWLRSHDTSPLTNEALPHRQLTPNVLVRSQIREYVETRQKRNGDSLAAAPVAVPVAVPEVAVPDSPSTVSEESNARGSTRRRRRLRREG